MTILMHNKNILLLVGDAREVLSGFPSDSVNMCITSPPYWGLRDYGVDGQLGLEPTFYKYIQKLADIFDEVRRVLTPDGTCWVNLGDTYGGSNCGYGQTPESAGFQNVARQTYYATSTRRPLMAKVMPKCLLMLPFRFAIEMVNRGWILRNSLIWHKPNCVPSSAKDRFTVDFEYLFFFTKNRRYYFETQYEPHLTRESRPYGIVRERTLGYDTKYVQVRGFKTKIHTRPTQPPQRHEQDINYSDRGRNKRCVWRIQTKPFRGSHFAVFPPALVETPIKAGCPKNGIVLDPFVGSGTTAEVALKLGRRCIGIDLNPEYIEIANRRLESLKRRETT